MVGFTHRRGKRVRPVSSGLDLRSGDIVWFGWITDQAEQVEARLRDAQFQRPDSPPAPEEGELGPA